MENEEVKKGKILSGLSFALFVYNLAGGRISESGNLLGSAVIVENPTVVEVSIFIFFCYLAYRYKMALPNPLKSFRKATMGHIIRDKSYHKRQYV
ncbi:hypothetical protein DYD21_09420 [Rhodohalobacter sp. SW132]|nr:hypothetical protein DYD21_09420 [Rhodohalobacter sp. SW132]